MTARPAGVGRAGAALFAVGVAGAFAQQPPTFRSAVDAVRLDVSVMRGGRPVVGLRPDDFLVTDDGVPQRVDVGAIDTLPISVMLVLDVSASVQGTKLAHLAEASAALIGALRPRDRAALVTFSHEVDLLMPMTGDRRALVGALDSLAPGGATALRDAIHLALQLRPDDDSRPVVVVFSDGMDTASWLSVTDLLTLVRRSGAVIHAVELADDRAMGPAGDGYQPRLSDCLSPPPSVSGRRATSSPFLECVIREAGGRRWPAASAADLRPLFAQALDEMRARYLLTFHPSGVPHQGWHELKVSLRSGRADIRTRAGYFVPHR